MPQGRRITDTATCTLGPGNARFGTIHMLFEAYDARRRLPYPGRGERKGQPIGYRLEHPAGSLFLDIGVRCLDTGYDPYR